MSKVIHRFRHPILVIYSFQTCTGAMFMTRNFPELLAGTTPELVFPPLTAHAGTSRTFSAVLNADSGWRRLLDEDHHSLITHLASMKKLAEHFCTIDSSLSSTLSRALDGGDQ